MTSIMLNHPSAALPSASFILVEDFVTDGGGFTDFARVNIEAQFYKY